MEDFDVLVSRLSAVSKDRGLGLSELGEVDGFPLVLLSPPPSDRPNVLIAAGFHGEEPAGCWGLLHFLEHRFPSKVNLSVLPVVNPTGIRLGTRLNVYGQNPNCGFCHTSDEPSVEGKILLQSLDKLLPLASDGFLSLHEDIDETRFYLYTFEHLESPGDFTKSLVQIEREFFEPLPDGLLHEGGKVVDGAIFNCCDGSFEDLLFHRGVPRTACTETPGKLDFYLRTAANAAIAETFCRVASNG